MGFKLSHITSVGNGDVKKENRKHCLRSIFLIFPTPFIRHPNYKAGQRRNDRFMKSMKRRKMPKNEQN